MGGFWKVGDVTLGQAREALDAGIESLDKREATLQKVAGIAEKVPYWTYAGAISLCMAAVGMEIIHPSASSVIHLDLENGMQAGLAAMGAILSAGVADWAASKGAYRSREDALDLRAAKMLMAEPKDLERFIDVRLADKIGLRRKTKADPVAGQPTSAPSA